MAEPNIFQRIQGTGRDFLGFESFDCWKETRNENWKERRLAYCRLGIVWVYSALHRNISSCHCECYWHSQRSTR